MLYEETDLSIHGELPVFTPINPTRWATYLGTEASAEEEYVRTSMITLGRKMQYCISLGQVPFGEACRSVIDAHEFRTIDEFVQVMQLLQMYWVFNVTHELDRARTRQASLQRRDARGDEPERAA